MAELTCSAPITQPGEMQLGRLESQLRQTDCPLTCSKSRHITPVASSLPTQPSPPRALRRSGSRHKKALTESGLQVSPSEGIRPALRRRVGAMLFLLIWFRNTLSF